MDQILLYVFRRDGEATSFVGFNKNDMLEIGANCSALGTLYGLTTKNMAHGSNALKLVKDISYWR
jgi:hypothetical protein